MGVHVRSVPIPLRPPGRIAALLPVVVWSLGPTALSAQDSLAGLREEIRRVRLEYDARLRALEARVAALETEQESSAPPSDEERQRLEELAREAAEGGAARGAPAPPPDAVGGAERNLNRLNPEISATGIILGSSSSRGREAFEAQEFEIDLQAALDPFSRMRLTVALREGEAEVEEGYVVYPSVARGMGLSAGRFRQTFGPLNRQHLHALPQTGYPLVYTTFFGEEGLAQTGISFDWLLPRPWASANELTLQLTDGSNDAFGGEDFERLVTLARLKSFWETGPASYFEWGLSGIVGGTGASGDSRVWGTDFTYHWQPPQRAKYRELTWRTEVLLSQRDEPFGRRREAWGGYSYLEGLVGRGLSLGLRYDRAEDPLAPDDRTWAVVPYVSWWQSEYVRLRGEYQRLEHDLRDESEDRFTLQLTFAAGPHKHETY